MLWMYITEVIGFLSKFKNNRTPVKIYSVAKKKFHRNKSLYFCEFYHLSASVLLKLSCCISWVLDQLNGLIHFLLLLNIKKINWNKEQSELWIIQSQYRKHSQLIDSYLWHRFRVILAYIVTLKVMKSKFVAS